MSTTDNNNNSNNNNNNNNNNNIHLLIHLIAINRHFSINLYDLMNTDYLTTIYILLTVFVCLLYF